VVISSKKTAFRQRITTFFLHRAKQVVPIAKKSVPDKKKDHLFSSWREKGGY